MMPAPALWSIPRRIWHTWLTYAAALTAPPPLPDHIRRDAIVHCVGIGTVQVTEIDTEAGLCFVRQPLGSPWVAPYSALTIASAAEVFAFHAELTRRTRPMPAPAQRGQVIAFPIPARRDGSPAA